MNLACNLESERNAPSSSRSLASIAASPMSSRNVIAAPFSLAIWQNVSISLVCLSVRARLMSTLLVSLPHCVGGARDQGVPKRARQRDQLVDRRDREDEDSPRLVREHPDDYAGGSHRAEEHHRLDSTGSLAHQPLYL